jgi:hypothetical protein
MSPDLNPIEHICDMLGRRILAREPPVQNIRQLEAALHREWQQLAQQDIQRLIGGMRRRVLRRYVYFVQVKSLIEQH